MEDATTYEVWSRVISTGEMVRQLSLTGYRYPAGPQQIAEETNEQVKAHVKSSGEPAIYEYVVVKATTHFELLEEKP